MRTYKIEVKATFEGTVMVKAQNKADAVLFAKRDFGINFPNVRTSNEETVMNWDIGSYPTIIKFC